RRPHAVAGAPSRPPRPMNNPGGLLLLLCVATFCGPACADGFSGTAEVLTNQLGALTRTSPRGALEPVRVSFREGSLRLQFRDNAGDDYVLLLPDGAAVGWILAASGGARPVPGMRWPLRFDAGQ